MRSAFTLPSKSIADRYVQLLSTYSDDIRLAIIEGLSASMRKKSKKADNDMSFLSQLTGAWDDGTPTEELMKEIRSDEQSRLQRDVETW